jgi:hypothetical protein
MTGLLTWTFQDVSPLKAWLISTRYPEGPKWDIAACYSKTAHRRRSINQTSRYLKMHPMHVMSSDSFEHRIRLLELALLDQYFRQKYGAVLQIGMRKVLDGVAWRPPTFPHVYFVVPWSHDVWTRADPQDRQGQRARGYRRRSLGQERCALMAGFWRCLPHPCFFCEASVLSLVRLEVIR